ncbi:hypothetical protein [Algoriphagus chordae]|uniref:Uncharacterized protein n=1 Tax=Algoriphagus chordae TaxID=237019 RepID=A0A2W7SRS1_9BACT|nr:hypothetical protein [Algoriphagus chordae]PZX53322.1 hypothetical protein LV85_01740 [Algoriphagus chordae]
MKNTDYTILSQIQKAHSIGSVVTLISYILNAMIRRISGLEFLTLPLIILVSLTIIGSAYFLFQSVKHKNEIEKPRKNNIAFIIRIVINLGLLALMVY